MASFRKSLSLAFCMLACCAVASAQLKSLSFKEIPPNTEAEFIYRATDAVTIDGVTYPIKYKPLLESGKTYPGFDGQPWVAGTILDKNGVVVTTADIASADPALARDFDFTSIFMKFGKIWMITQNEDSYGSFFLFELSQNATDGELTIVKARTINTNALYGGIRPCSGSQTPWNTHLGGLESVQDARPYPPSSAPSAFLAQQVVQRLPRWQDVNPYWYGSYIEVGVSSAAGETKVYKHYAMGRAPWETGVVLPDQRTVICTDDTSSGGIITMFVADKPRDLSSGRIFAMKPTQINAADGGSWTVEWIPLTQNSVSDSYVASFVEKPNGYNDSVKFADIFDVATPVFANGVPDLSKLPEGFRPVRSIGSRYEWLKVKPGMEALAATLETARYVSYMGGCTEWTKAEGAAYDWRTREVYFALTAIQSSMLDGHANDVGGFNYNRLPQNIPGAVYKMKTAPTNISAYTPINIIGVLNSYGAPNAGSGNNTVPQGSIASPDNVGIMSRYRTITIAEDCDTQHISNYGWAYNLDSRAITRIFAVPYDAEVTSPYYFPNVGSHSYLTATVQHPRPQDMPCTVGYWALPRE